MPTTGLVDLDVTAHLIEAARLKYTGLMAEAEDHIREAVQLDPGRPDVLIALADLALTGKKSDDAARYARRAIMLSPKNPGGHQMLSAALGAGMDLDGSIAEVRRALDIAPTAGMHAALIFMLDMHQTPTPEVLLEERKRFDGWYCERFTQAAAPHTNRPDPHRRLRIGYVGADFRNHSAASTFKSAITHADPEQIETYLYSTFVGWDRSEQAAFKGVANWREAALPPDDLAALIRADRIDILVDCAGYTAGGMLETFARKPAPIQLTGWGYATGTGLSCMDYVIGDAITIPEGYERYYTEQVLRLPSFIGYGDAEHAPPVVKGPSEIGGALTFGCFSRPNLISPACLDAWGAILRAKPESRLYLRNGMYEDAGASRTIINALVARGVADRRIDIKGATSRWEYLFDFGKADVILDTFPQGGGVSAQDALLMGVPVITLPGLMMHQRKALSLLEQCGIGQLAAPDLNGYIERAIAITPKFGDRVKTRAAFLQTSMGQPQMYADAVGEAYREVWRTWCADQAKPASPALSLVESEAA